MLFVKKNLAPWQPMRFTLGSLLRSRNFFKQKILNLLGPPPAHCGGGGRKSVGLFIGKGNNVLLDSKAQKVLIKQILSASVPEAAVLI